MFKKAHKEYINCEHINETLNLKKILILYTVKIQIHRLWDKVS